MPDLNLLSQATPRLSLTRKENPRPSAQVIKEMVLGEGTYGTVLYVWYVDRWGHERDDEGRMACLYWTPETIKMEIEETVGVVMPKANFDKLMAVICIITTDLFYRDVQRFIELSNILSGDDFQPDEFDPADSVECAWAIIEALLNDPPDAGETGPFSDEVRRYLGIVLRNEGIVDAPDILKLALFDDHDPAGPTDYADDPVMFSAMYDVQQGKTEEILTVLRDGMTELLAQLEALPVENGSVQELKSKLHKAINT